MNGWRRLIGERGMAEWQSYKEVVCDAGSGLYVKIRGDSGSKGSDRGYKNQRKEVDLKTKNKMKDQERLY